jgi:elongation factor G
LDGSFHPVDSDQLSFEICARQAFKSAASQASPKLMEPIMKVEIVTPEEYMGDIIGDLNRRRGEVAGMEDKSGAKVISAKVPLSEQFGYVTVLRTLSSGRATSSMEFSHYQEVPRGLAEKVLEEVKGRVDLL